MAFKWEEVQGRSMLINNGEKLLISKQSDLYKALTDFLYVNVPIKATAGDHKNTTLDAYITDNYYMKILYVKETFSSKIVAMLVSSGNRLVSVIYSNNIKPEYKNELDNKVIEFLMTDGNYIWDEFVQPPSSLVAYIDKFPGRIRKIITQQEKMAINNRLRVPNKNYYYYGRPAGSENKGGGRRRKAKSKARTKTRSKVKSRTRSKSRRKSKK